MEDMSGVEQKLPLQICIVGDQLAKDQNFVKTCLNFGYPVITSSTGEEVIQDTEHGTVFVVSDFSGPTFNRLHEAKKQILGPPAVKDLALNNLPLLQKRFPVYCLALHGCVIVFSGIRRKSDLDKNLKYIHSMGGSVKKDIACGKPTTQVVAGSSIGDKYQYATTFSIPVLTESWLTAAWDHRETVGYRATSSEDYNTYRLPTFQGNNVFFHGFEDSEKQHMAELLVANGGRVMESLGKETTHLIVDENTVENLPDDLDIPSHCFLVKGEWFWNSIQIEAAADIKHYKWRKDGNSTATLLSPNRSCNMFSPPSSAMTLSPSTSNRKRKRLRRAEMIATLAADSPAHKRRSSVSELAMLSISGSFLDNTDRERGDRTLVSPEASPARGVEIQSETGGAKSDRVFDAKTATARQQVFHEFVTTESNYVGVLECINKISNEAEDPNQGGGALLDEQEMKIIFGSMPPILKVHTDMLKKLIEAESAWTEDTMVGTIILQFAADLLKAYPPFVNFFENTKNKIQEVDKKNPRFHAFLKKCERRPECSRQSLTELMIRPVQRLPSISLLLNDILKHTKKQDVNHPDCAELEKALAKIKEVMTHLNEEKRRTEGQIHIFDVYSEIENCPASIVSSHRSFVTRADAIEVAAEHALCGKGYELTMFLFTDILVIAKRKSSKGMGMMRSPSAASLAAGQQHVLPHKALKFVAMIHLSAVRRLVDILDQEDCDASVMSNVSTITSFTPNNLVAIVCRMNEDLQERCYTLQMVVDSAEDKWSFLRTMSRHVCNTLCRPDPDQLLVRLSARDMSLDASDLNVSSFSRALSSFHKTKQKVGRAFSFNKTPSKLKRAVSTVISPLTNSAARSNRTQVLGTPGVDMISEMRTERSPSNMSEISLTTPGGAESFLLHQSPACVSLGETISLGAGSYHGPTPGHRVSPYGHQATDTVSGICRSSSGAVITNNSVIGNSVSVDNVDFQGRSTPLTSRTMVAQSCVDLMDADSPRRLGTKTFPKKFNFNTESPRREAGGSENKDPDFRTPNLCSRPSFRDKFRSRPRAGTLGGFSRKGSMN